MVVSGLTITPERSARVTMLGPYYTSGKCVLTKSERIAAATEAAQIDSADLRVVGTLAKATEFWLKDPSWVKELR